MGFKRVITLPLRSEWTLTQLLPALESIAQNPLRARRVQLSVASSPLQAFSGELESVFVLTPPVLKLSSGDDERESLFRCETQVVERSAPGY
jgi:hypothetical protein